MNLDPPRIFCLLNSYIDFTLYNLWNSLRWVQGWGSSKKSSTLVEIETYDIGSTCPFLLGFLFYLWCRLLVRLVNWISLMVNFDFSMKWVTLLKSQTLFFQVKGNTRVCVTFIIYSQSTLILDLKTSKKHYFIILTWNRFLLLFFF